MAYFVSLLFLLFLLVTAGSLFHFLPSEMTRLRVICRTLGRDLRAIYRYLKSLWYIKRCIAQNRTFMDNFKNVVKKYKNTTCFIFEDEEWTYQRVDEFSNKIANCFLSQGYSKGDEVALFMENCPEYICIWVGLAKIGVVTAFINTNLRLESLAHSVNVIDTKAIIFGGNLQEAVMDAMPYFDGKDTLQYFCYLKKSVEANSLTSFHVKSLNDLLMDSSDGPIDSRKYQITHHDKLLYIYTSGTTGLPKAAVFRHSRFLFFAVSVRNMCRMRDFEIFYNALPLYHSSGGTVFVSVVLNFGGTMVLAKKFSASNFWKDAVKYNVTVSQYIGEICRYLLNTPKTPEETQHNIRMIFGNGMRRNVWEEFQTRFRVKKIIEMYGSTEGNAALLNMFSKPGAVGFGPNILRCLYNIQLIKINTETGEPLRDDEGLCIPCKPGEPGEMVSKIARNNPLRAFDGYVNRADTQKKIITDCFEKGDSAFLTGDTLVMDEDRYFYFVDRLGDTFRWRGENVSTHEVEIVISKVLSNATCVVYGVEIPNVEGRAGMAAIQMDENLEEGVSMSDLYQNLTKSLPAYSVPLFIRLCSDIESTGTYKLKKVTLQTEGYNPEKTTDPIYFIDHKNQTYVPLTQDTYADIINGKMRF